MNILVLALSAASVFALPPTLKVPANERIIGGEAAAPNAFPSAVSLQILLPQGPGLCGGTLINNHAIVTAAHCLYNYGSQAPVPASSVRIGYGSNSQSRETTVQARQVHLHPDFNPAETNNDIAVILIDQLTALNDSVRPATIFNGPLPEGTALTAVGWGLTSATGTSGDLPDLLQQTGIVVGQRDACRQLVPDYESSDGPQICTQNSLKPGADTCQGDSGTGVFVTSNGKSFLAGLTSFGSAPDGDPTCALDNGLAIYTHVFYFRAFLDEFAGAVENGRRRPIMLAKRTDELELTHHHKHHKHHHHHHHHHHHKHDDDDDDSDSDDEEPAHSRKPEHTLKDPDHTWKDPDHTWKDPDHTWKPEHTWEDPDHTWKPEHTWEDPDHTWKDPDHTWKPDHSWGV